MFTIIVVDGFLAFIAVLGVMARNIWKTVHQDPSEPIRATSHHYEYRGDGGGDNPGDGGGDGGGGD